jgi:hypothetical protein
MSEKLENNKLILTISLGCFGNKEDDFIICPGIKNNIYTLYNNNIFYNDIMNFLDKCKLFDNPHYDFNTIKNFLSIFKGKFFSPLQPSWNDKKYKTYIKFCLDHKDCGLELKLLPNGNYTNKSVNDRPEKKLPQMPDQTFNNNFNKNKVLLLLKNKK